MDKKIEKLSSSSRRSFLKKAAYVAPAIVALGTLNTPVYAGTTGSNATQMNDYNDGRTNTTTASSEINNTNEGKFTSHFR